MTLKDHLSELMQRAGLRLAYTLGHVAASSPSPATADLGNPVRHHQTRESLLQVFEVQVSKLPELSDYQCNAALVLAKPWGLQPEALAESLCFHLGLELADEATLSVAKPGFVNIRLSDAYLQARLSADLLSQTQGVVEIPRMAAEERPVLLDFGGPNLAKTLHAGHLRPHLIGDSLQRLLRLRGEQVTSDIHMGDWGTPIGMLIAQLWQHAPVEMAADADFIAKYRAAVADWQFAPEDLNALYLQAKQNFDASDAFKTQARNCIAALQSGRSEPARIIWQKLRDSSVLDLRHLYDRLDVSFTQWNGESDANAAIPAMLRDLQHRGISHVSDGAIVIAAERLGLVTEASHVPPLMLVKADGGYTYAATDLATLKLRVEAGFKRLLYVVDSRQSQHFQLLFAAARLAGYASPDVELTHIGHGTINGADGKPFKTRDGKAAALVDLLDLADAKALAELPDPSVSADAQALRDMAKSVALAALKFQEFRNARLSDYVFETDKFTDFEGKTGPYLLYAKVRCSAILSKARELGCHPKRPLDRMTQPAWSLLLPQERAVAILLLQFSETVVAAAQKYEPSLLANYAFRLAQAFSSFYASCNILQEPDKPLQAARLNMVLAVERTLLLAGHCLGIKMPMHLLRRSKELAEASAD